MEKNHMRVLFKAVENGLPSPSIPPDTLARSYRRALILLRDAKKWYRECKEELEKCQTPEDVEYWLKHKREASLKIEERIARADVLLRKIKEQKSEIRRPTQKDDNP